MNREENSTAQLKNEGVIDFSIIENAKNPQGDAGRAVLDRMNQSHAPLTEWGFDHIRLGGRVLDVGCGGGNALRLAMSRDTEKDARFYGIDYSDIAVEKASSFNRGALRSGRLSLTKADVSRLPFEDGFFDTVYSVESYFFWPDLPQALSEIFRVLKRGGTFAVIVEMVAGDMSREYQEITDHMHMNVLSPGKLQQAFEQAGFANVSYDWDKEKGWLVLQGKKPGREPDA